VNAEQFITRVCEMLRSEPAGTAALLDDLAIAMLLNNGIVFRHIDDPYTGTLGDQFELTDEVWAERREQLTEWFDHPEFAQMVADREGDGQQ